MPIRDNLPRDHHRLSPAIGGVTHFHPRQAQTPPALSTRTSSTSSKTMHVKRFTLTSKKNWWMVELDDEEEPPPKSAATYHPPPYSTDRSLQREEYQRTDSGNREHYYERYFDHRPDRIRGEQSSQAARMRSRSRQRSRPPTRPPSPEQYNPPPRPNSIFSFPTPSIYSAAPNPTASLQPFTQGSASELFKCIVKKPEYVTLEINGEIQSNASDVVTQFLAELRVYTTVSAHRNLPIFMGCLDGIGMVMEYIEGRTLYQYMADGALTRSRKCDFHNQLLDAICHLHSFGLSHGDLSTLNIQVTHNDTTLKLFDFGRSIASTSILAPPDGEPVDPFAWMTSNPSTTLRVEQIQPGTRPFCAPEILRGECTDAQLADAYSFGMILVCLERSELVDVKPWEQKKDKLPADLFNGCVMWVDRIQEYLKHFETRRRLSRADMVMILDD